MKKSILLSLLLMITLSQSLLAVVHPEAPHFEVKDKDGKMVSATHLPLIHTEADVSIAGIIADVRVTQVYVNSGDQPIEAIYVFPGSSQSAVYGLTMTIEDRVIKAKIKEKKQAQAIFDKAKSEGKSASLLTQHRPNVFQMNVANILPGDTITVELQYNEVLIPEEGIYTFFYPVVIGERYDKDNNSWMKNPFANKNTQNKMNKSHTFDVNVHLEAGMSLSDVRCATHDVTISQPKPDQANIHLKNGKGHEGDRNYILQYRLANDSFQSGMLLFEGPKENFYLYTVQPPKRIQKEDIPPREYVFIVDVSGSMNGFPIETSKSLLRDLISNLKATDLFNVMLFAGSSSVFSPQSVPATPKNVQKAIAFFSSQSGSGGTEVLPALKRAYALPTADNYSRTFIVATDGLVTVEREAFEMIENNLDKANVFPFGIGSHMNEFMIKGMAHAGHGEAFIINNAKEAAEQARRFRKMIESPVLTNIQVQLDGFDAYDIEPLKPHDIFAERPLVIYGKYRGKAKGQLGLIGQSGKSPYSTSFDVTKFKPSKSNKALQYLWARTKIRKLQDYNKLGQEDKKIVNEITQLGLKYNLLTDYTSFVAVDTKVRTNPSTKKNAIHQAKNNHSGGVPEPHEWALIMMLFGFIAFVFFTKDK